MKIENNRATSHHSSFLNFLSEAITSFNSLTPFNS